ncbi:innexin unc-9 [Patella vulgata]|uniref:innexin unc-9 n=1 Tax=Patella vulgata TaxID=6465 RepID=UPI00218081A8|nr:innexin unc-9 [Patella vulgata]
MLGAIGSVFGSVAKLTGINAPQDDDFVDRLNHVITVSIFSLFAIFVTTRQFAGDPINCWLSDEYKDSHKSYIHSYCWIQNTYKVSWDGIIPQDEKERQMTSIKYYQWVPVILMFQILLFKLPNVFWKVLNELSGINIEKIGQLAENTQIGDMESRDTEIKNLATCISRWLIYKREHRYNVFSRLRSKISRFSVILFFLGLRNGTYLVGLYMFTKLLYFVNVVAQFYMLNTFLSDDFSMYGIEVIRHLRDVGEIKDSEFFPKITFCDFYVRQMTNVQPHTTQCVLPINLFTEKIYIFIWFWMFFLAMANGYSFLRWLYKVVFRKNRKDYVEKYLSACIDVSQHEAQVSQFIDVFLRDDGVFLLRVVCNNSTPLVMMDLIKELWALFVASNFCKKDELTKPLYPNIQENPIDTIGALPLKEQLH